MVMLLELANESAIARRPLTMKKNQADVELLIPTFKNL